MSTDEGVLEELDMVLIGIDRPTYGLSDPDPDRQGGPLPSMHAFVLGQNLSPRPARPHVCASCQMGAWAIPFGHVSVHTYTCKHLRFRAAVPAHLLELKGWVTKIPSLRSLGQDVPVVRR